MFIKNEPLKVNTYPTLDAPIPFRKPGPIKHWRNQYGSKTCKSTSEIYIDNTCNGIESNNTCIGGSHNKTKSATTILSKTYYTTRDAYLKAKNKTYIQNMSRGEKLSENVYKMTNAIDQTCNQLNYQRSNITYHTQGAVDAGLNISRKHNSSVCKCNQQPYINICNNRKININL
jgi:hypothetical protein